MATSLIILTTLKKLKSIIYPYYHLISQTHFPYKNLVITQVGSTPFIADMLLNYFLGLWSSRKLLM